MSYATRIVAYAERILPVLHLLRTEGSEYLRRVLTGISLLCLALGCARFRYCCLKFAPGTDAAAYCDNHRDAVGLFIEAGSTLTQKRERLSAFKHFFARIKYCQTATCIHAELARGTGPCYDETSYQPAPVPKSPAPGGTTLLREFICFYQTEHRFAEQTTSILEKQKATLILCGFRDAISRYEKLFKRKRGRQ